MQRDIPRSITLPTADRSKVMFLILAAYAADFGYRRDSLIDFLIHFANI